jgi:uncharacterized protein with HEPN domain
MRRKPEAFLWDVREAAARIREFVGDLDFDGFSRNALVRAAVERQFEIIGEALNRLSRLVPRSVEQIPDSARIIAFRNILTHGYAVLDHSIVWSVIEKHLPELEKAVAALLEKGPNEVQDSRSTWPRCPVDLGRNLMRTLSRTYHSTTPL